MLINQLDSSKSVFLYILYIKRAAGCRETLLRTLLPDALRDVCCNKLPALVKAHIPRCYDLSPVSLLANRADI